MNDIKKEAFMNQYMHYNKESILERLFEAIEYINNENEKKCSDNCKFHLSDNGNYPIDPCMSCSRFYTDMFSGSKL